MNIVAGRASRVCKRWREGIRQALACQSELSFAGWRPDDAAIARLVEGAGSLKELNMSDTINPSCHHIHIVSQHPHFDLYN